MNKKDLDAQPAGTSRCAVLAVALTCIASAMPGIAAAAPCPPGYHGSAPHCMPDQAGTHHPYATTAGHHFSGATPLGSSKPSPTQAKIADWHKTGPAIGPGPIEHQGSANPHGIIFVGGKTSSKAATTRYGKAALNPQPIPPGHGASTLPHAPVKKSVNAHTPKGNPS
jgi:hypothetical protein